MIIKTRELQLSSVISAQMQLPLFFDANTSDLDVERCSWKALI